MEWLSDHDHIKEQQDSISRYKEGTGMWLLNDPKFKEWEAGAYDTLLCVGMPGAGKTVMSAMVIRHLFQAPRISNDEVAVAFLYFRYDLRDTQSTERLLGSLIRQLVSQLVKAPDAIEQDFGCVKKGRCIPPSLEMLQDAVGCFSCVYFVIDALDEGAVQHMNGLISAIRCLRRARIKLFTTSRFIPEIQAQFEDNHSIEIRGSDFDIRSYATDRLSELPRCVQNNLSLQEEITQAIVTSTQGMFLLAKLHIDSLKDKRTLKAMRYTLETLPSGSSAYDAAYDGAITRISDQSESDGKLAQQVLTWLVYAMRPISEIDLETALAVELGERNLDPDNIVPVVELLSLCAGLVALDKESKTVRLCHYTTKEYFSHNPQHLLRNPHRVLSNVCVSFLGIDDLKFECYGEDPDRTELSSSIHRSTFLSYAASHWEDHDSAAQPCVNNNELSQKMALETHLLRHNNLMESYLRARRVRIKDHRQDSEWAMFKCERRTGMQYAAAYGNLEHVSALLEFGLDPNDSTHGTTALFEAARGHHASVVRLLIEAKADVHFEAKESAHTALTAAIDMHFAWLNPVYSSSCRKDHCPSTTDPSTTVALLLEAGADPEHLPGNLDKLTALMRACEYGMETVVNMLCETGVDVDRRGGNDLWGTGGRAALHVAASHGHESIVKRLMQAGCDPDIADNRNRSPAVCAAAGGHWTILDLLLDTAAIDLHRETADGDTILDIARNSENVPDALIERLTCARPGRPLIKAARARKDTAVEMSLEAVADPHLMNTDGVTALHIAARLGHNDDQHAPIAITQALLEANVDVDTRGRDGITALMLASEAGQCELLRFLLNKDANVLLRDNRGWTPLTYAAEKGHACIVRILVNAGADVNIASESGTTALICAAGHGCFDAAAILVEAGAEVNAQMANGTSGLILSAAGGHKDLTRLLLNSGADASLANKKGETALIGVMRANMKPMQSGNLEGGIRDLLPMLLEAGVDINHATDNGDTALLIATDPSYPQPDDARLLLEAGADPSASKRAKQDGLISWRRVSKMDIQVLGTLLKAGASPIENDENGMTALMRVSWEGNQVDKLKKLLRYGASPDAVNKNGETALTLAVQRLNCGLSAETVKELLKVGAKPNHEDAAGKSVLFHLVSQNYRSNTRTWERVFKALVDAGGSIHTIHKSQETLLMRSLRHPGMTKFLLAVGADPRGSDQMGRNTVMLASMAGNDRGVEAVKLLLDCGVDPNQSDCNGNNALMLAARSSPCPLTSRMLLSVGTDPHKRDADGLTSLMLVASTKWKSGALIPDPLERGAEMLSELIEAGVGVDLRDKDGNTALMYAAGHALLVQLLLKAGANPNLANNLGQSVLIQCCLRIEITWVTSDSGADTNKLDKTQRNLGTWTAYAKQRLNQNFEVVLLILSVPGVSLDHEDDNGDTALMCAERLGNNEIARLIREEIQRRENSVKAH